MQREIKFRAWDGEKWTFFPVGVNQIEHPDFPFQQYTGLQSKSGAEIYEGDIVRHEVQPYFESDEKTFETFEIKYEELSNCGDCTNDSGIGFNFFLEQPEELEVIGNIFENPELLI